MALEESAVSALFDALRVGEGTDLVRELAQWALQQLIDLEAASKVGADPWERTDDRVTYRNGIRPKVLSTARPPPTHRSGPLRRGHDRVRAGRLHPGRR